MCFIRISESDESNQPQIVHELTEVIRDWSVIWKQKYVVRTNYKYT